MLNDYPNNIMDRKYNILKIIIPSSVLSLILLVNSCRYIKPADGFISKDELLGTWYSEDSCQSFLTFNSDSTFISNNILGINTLIGIDSNFVGDSINVSYHWKHENITGRWSLIDKTDDEPQECRLSYIKFPNTQKGNDVMHNMSVYVVKVLDINSLKIVTVLEYFENDPDDYHLLSKIKSDSISLE